MRIILPTHLFPEKPVERECVIALDPVFFTGPDGTFKIHKGKLAYMVAAAEEYAALHGYSVMYPDEVVYPRGAVCYEPMDRFVEKKLRKAGVEISGYPGFVLDPKAYEGPLKLVSVYKEARRAANLLQGVPSMDARNRAPPTPELIRSAKPPRKNVTPAMKRAIAFVEKRFPDHYGDASACAYFPTTRRSALARLREYAKHGILLMKFQDAIVKGESFLGHSALSAAINLGLIGPLEVCREIVKSKASLADKEGFVRQILGWRELTAIVSARRKLPTKFPVLTKPWYDATTGIEPLDDCITRALKTGYLHHIERLMVVLNAMTLFGMSEGAIYRWFMEVVSIDAYDWVMVGNVAVMGGFEAGVARKPYISGSAYIKKMSMGFGDDWQDKWDAMFYNAVPRFPYFKRVLQGKKYKAKDWKTIARGLEKNLNNGSKNI